MAVKEGGSADPAANSRLRDCIAKAKAANVPNDNIERIIKKAADELHIEGIISCHSLRKTFGYHAWKKGTPPAVIMTIYNHSSLDITKRYLSIDQDDKDKVFLEINL